MPTSFDRISPDVAAPAYLAKDLFGRKRGKKLTSLQSRLLADQLPAVSIDVSVPIETAASLFERAFDDYWLEIGFGSGSHLVADAVREPGIGFIGCEPFVNGLAKCMVQIDEGAIGNIRIYAGSAQELIEALPASSLGRVNILYPDPWPKQRQRKRRLISDEVLSALARVMRPAATLRFATDIDDYASWTLSRILRSKEFLWPAAAEADWTTPWPQWPGTRYEEKALREGRKPIYLTFQRR